MMMRPISGILSSWKNKILNANAFHVKGSISPSVANSGINKFNTLTLLLYRIPAVLPVPVWPVNLSYDSTIWLGGRTRWSSSREVYLQTREENFPRPGHRTRKGWRRDCYDGRSCVSWQGGDNSPCLYFLEDHKLNRNHNKSFSKSSWDSRICWHCQTRKHQGDSFMISSNI